MDISSFPCTQLVFAFSLGWTLKEVNINGDFNQYIWAFSLGWTQETDVRVTSSSLLISSGKPEEVFPTNIFSVLNECPTPIIYWAKIIQYNPHSISTDPLYLVGITNYKMADCVSVNGDGRWEATLFFWKPILLADCKETVICPNFQFREISQIGQTSYFSSQNYCG